MIIFVVSVVMHDENAAYLTADSVQAGRNSDRSGGDLEGYTLSLSHHLKIS